MDPLALARELLGELYRAYGDAARAATNDQRFIALWANADTAPSRGWYRRDYRSRSAAAKFVTRLIARTSPKAAQRQPSFCLTHTFLQWDFLF
jgi:hypothetical protein